MRAANGLVGRVLAAGGWAVGGRLAFAFSGFCVNAVIARLYAPHEVGGYFLLVSLVGVTVLLAQAGLQTTVVQQVAEALGRGEQARAAGVLRVVLRCGLLSAAACALVVALLGPAAGNWWQALTFERGLYPLAALWVVGLTLSNLLSEGFRGLHENASTAIFGGLLINLCLLAALGAARLAGAGGLPLLISLVCASVWLNAVCAFMRMRRHLLPRQPRAGAGTATMVEMYRLGAPLLVTSLAIFVTTQADLWIAAAMLDREQVALYGASARLVQLVMMPMLIMNAVLQPFLAEFHGRGDARRTEQLLRTASSAAGSIALVALLVVAFGGRDILRLAYGEFYGVGAHALLYLSAGQTFNVACGSAAVLMMMSGAGREVMRLSVLCSVFLLIAGPLAARAWGIEGLAAASAATPALHGLLCARWVLRTRGVRTYPGLVALRESLAALQARLPRRMSEPSS